MLIVKPIFHKLLIVMIMITFVPFCGGAPNGSDAKALESLWQQHLEKTSNHQRMVDICSRFSNRFSGSEFIPIVKTLAGWHYLKQQKWQKARNLFSNLLGSDDGDTLTKAAQRMSRRWLTRIKHQELRSALNRYYGEHIRFPEKLHQLKGIPEFNENLLSDAFNKPWEYKPKKIEFLGDSKPQDYILRSQILENSSSLDKFLNVPYGEGIKLKAPELVDNSANGRKVFTFHISQNVSPVLTPGNSYKGTTYVYSNYNLIILSNGDFWDIIKINHNDE